MTTTAADLPARREAYRRWYVGQYNVALRGGHDLSDVVHRHATKHRLNTGFHLMTPWELRHWRKWITRWIAKHKLD